MKEQKPYLLRAIYEWIIDSDCTPYLTIARPDLGWVHGVPAHLLQEEWLTLNISPTATRHLHIQEQAIEFETRFSGESCSVWVGMAAVASLFARENPEEGVGFPLDEALIQQGAKAAFAAKPSDNAAPSEPKKRGHLKIVK